MSTRCIKGAFLFLLVGQFGWGLVSAKEATPYNALTVQIFNDKALAVVGSKPSAKVLANGFAWLEGPVWLQQQGCLIFSDIPSHRVMRYCPQDGTDTYLADSGYSNGLILNEQGELVLMQSRSRQVAKMAAPLDQPVADYQVLTDKFEGKRLNSPNDVSLASDGSLYFTDPPYGLEKQLQDPAKELDFQGVYRLTTNGELSAQDKTLTYPNGILLLAQEKQLIVAVSDPKDPAWYVYDVAPSGKLSNRKRFFNALEVDFQHNNIGLPDGLKQHSNGTIFATGPGGVWLFSTDGSLLAHIGLDRPVANLTFNSDESTLFLTAQDSLISVDLVPAGLFKHTLETAQ